MDPPEVSIIYTVGVLESSIGGFLLHFIILYYTILSQSRIWGFVFCFLLGLWVFLLLPNPWKLPTCPDSAVKLPKLGTWM